MSTENERLNTLSAAMSSAMFDLSMAGVNINDALSDATPEKMFDRLQIARGSVTDAMKHLVDALQPEYER